MSGVVGNANFAELLWPGIKGLYGHEYDRYKPIYTKYTQKESSDKAFEKYQGVTNLGLARTKRQGEQISYTVPLMGYQKVITPTEFALGVAVTRVMYDDDQYGYINRTPKMLNDAYQQTCEVMSANVLNNGFTTAAGGNAGSSAGSDGVALFSGSHPFVDAAVSGTGLNTPATAADLTQTSWEQAGIDIANILDDRGRNIMVNMKTIVVPTGLQWQVKKILKTEKSVDSGDNTINPLFGITDSIVNPYLTDTDAWFVQTDVTDGIIFLERAAPELVRDNEFDTLNLKFGVWGRFAVDFVQWRAWYGSPGA